MGPDEKPRKAVTPPAPPDPFEEKAPGICQHDDGNQFHLQGEKGYWWCKACGALGLENSERINWTRPEGV
jgi:hypothetical protein